jgi:hypothetical protein
MPTHMGSFVGAWHGEGLYLRTSLSRTGQCGWLLHRVSQRPRLLTLCGPALFSGPVLIDISWWMRQSEGRRGRAVLHCFSSEGPNAYPCIVHWWGHVRWLQWLEDNRKVWLHYVLKREIVMFLGTRRIGFKDEWDDPKCAFSTLSNRNGSMILNLHRKSGPRAMHLKTSKSNL